MTAQPEARLKHAAALQERGVIALLNNQVSLAAELLGQAVSLDPSSVLACLNYGTALHEQRRFEEAVKSCERAIELAPRCAQAFYNRGNALRELHKLTAAVESYDRAIGLKADYAEAYLNRGLALSALERPSEAIASYEIAITICPRSPDPHFNRANELRRLGRHEAALGSYDRAIALQPGFADAHLNRGITLFQLHRYPEAIASFDRVLSFDADATAVRSMRLHSKMQICDWSGFDHDVDKVSRGVAGAAAVTNPFVLLTVCDSVDLQQRAAARWAAVQCPPASVAAIPARGRGDRIHLGYFSADYHEHATSCLIAQLLELHDRSRFKITGFSFGPPSAGAMRKRLQAAFDEFIDVRGQSDAAVAALARGRGIDIAVDLKGFTQDNRAGIFAHRAAPLQVSFLGYPGTMGAHFIDYLIADRTLIPAHGEPFYAEKIIYLPHSYQVNDATRTIAPKSFTRAELNLPTAGFVFCCFNNAYKIAPATFARWMRILARVDGSVLWLLGDNPGMMHNLRREARAHGIAPERLVFADRIDPPHHLARHRAADLFIDTLPYNAHTTASDALWSGVPVLTCPGDSFAARVAASLLTAVGLPELIASTPEHYERIAVQLATHPQAMKDIRERLSEKRLTAPLFDTPLYCKHLESAFTNIHERNLLGARPEHLYVE